MESKSNCWWLISPETVDELKAALENSPGGDALMSLESGLHKTGVKPYDM